MPVFSRPALPWRSLFGSTLLLLSILLFSACGTSEPVQKTDAPVSQTLRLTALDSTSGAPLDSAQAINRTFGDTVRTDSAGQFVLPNVKPALHVFDVSGYGYHPQRHVSVLVEPDDTTRSATTSLLPQRLTIDCTGKRPYFWDKLTKRYREDSTLISFKLTEVFAKDGEVRIQPVAVNDLSSPVFLPENFGALGHYEVLLYDGNNNRLSYTHKDAPRDDGHRIYSKADIRPVVPRDIERMEPSVVVVEDSVEEGTTIYARLDYTFSNDDTLEATSATTFPDLNLDSLQTPIFDTLRTAGAVQVPDSLVLKRDTTLVSVVGIDTTVTRDGYTLYSTLRDGNAAPNAEAARNLLYVPDSVVARTRRDSLRAIAEADTTVPDLDTLSAAFPDEPPPLQIVERQNTPGLQSLITNPEIIASLSKGLPAPTLSADSLLSVPENFRPPYLETPSLALDTVRRGLELQSDSALADSALLSAPASDSLFRLLDPAPTDTTVDPGDANPFVFPDPRERLAPDTDSITIDSLHLTIGPDADSVVTRSVVANDLHTPPEHSFWYLPRSMSRQNSRILVVDSTFFGLRARPYVDTTTVGNLTRLLPNRLGRRTVDERIPYPQQVARVPLGTYRTEYLTAWRELQEDNLEQHYCDIFPFPLNSDWRSTVMR